jgi:hypothetical protein
MNLMSVYMKKIIFLFLFIPNCVFAVDDISVEEALRNTYNACIGIEDRLQDLKKMAGINTAVTAVGTGTGIGATAVGIAKSNVDEEIQEMKVRLKKLRELVADKDHENKRDTFKNYREEAVNYSEERFDELNKKYGTVEENTDELENLTKKSKKLGHWRTGLLATTGATGIAGAVIASQNKVDDDLENQIKKCSDTVDILRKSVAVARLSGGDVYDSKEIVEACGQYKYIDVTSINKRAKSAEVSSIVTAATAVTGAVLSGIANSDSVREQGGQKEKNLNISSNVMSAGATVSGGVATIFNATQISLIKKTADIASSCSKALKG